MGKINLFNKSTDYESFEQGDAIFNAGDAGELAYVVKEGEVDILVAGNVIERVLPGGIFGEMALIDNKPRSASVIAVTDCKLVPLTESRFTLLVQQTPYFALEVMKVMADRLRISDESIGRN
jgi:CRP-like cAMP-binding protein